MLDCGAGVGVGAHSPEVIASLLTLQLAPEDCESAGLPPHELEPKLAVEPPGACPPQEEDASEARGAGEGVTAGVCGATAGPPHEVLGSELDGAGNGAADQPPDVEGEGAGAAGAGGGAPHEPPPENPGPGIGFHPLSVDVAD